MLNQTPKPHILRLKYLVLFWIAQAILIDLSLTALLVSEDVTIDSYFSALIDPDIAFFISFWVVVITVAQIIFLWPVRTPIAERTRRCSLRASLTAAALAVSAMLTAIVYAVIELAGAWSDFWTAASDLLHIDELLIFFVPLIISWIIITPLLLVFCRSSRRESLLSKLSRRIFAGTVVEAVLLIPLDIMVRRRTDCYCDTGSFWALSMLGSVGFFAAGPAVMLPILTRRRAAWYRTHCHTCGYSLSGLSPDSACPECGAFRPKPSPPASKQSDSESSGARSAP